MFHTDVWPRQILAKKYQGELAHCRNTEAVAISVARCAASRISFEDLIICRNLKFENNVHCLCVHLPLCLHDYSVLLLITRLQV